MPATVIPSFILGGVLAIPAALLTIILWASVRAMWPRYAALKTLMMWGFLVTIFAFLFTGLHWPAYGVLAFVGGNLLMTSSLFLYLWRRRPMRLRGPSRWQ